MTITINQDNLNASIRMLDKLGEAKIEHIKLVDEAQGERMEKLGELLSSQSFLDQFIALPDFQTAHKLFEDHGVLLSQEELDGWMLQIKALVKKLLENDGELSEEDLEHVSGGLSDAVVGIGAAGAAVGAGVGILVGSGFGSVIPVLGTTVGAVVGAAVGTVVGAVVGGLIGWFVDWVYS